MSVASHFFASRATCSLIAQRSTVYWKVNYKLKSNFLDERSASSTGRGRAEKIGRNFFVTKINTAPATATCFVSHSKCRTGLAFINVASFNAARYFRWCSLPALHPSPVAILRRELNKTIVFPPNRIWNLGRIIGICAGGPRYPPTTSISRALCLSRASYPAGSKQDLLLFYDVTALLRTALPPHHYVRNWKNIYLPPRRT